MYDARPRICCICGKVFYPAVSHKYKKTYRRRVYIACGYTCYTEMEKEIERQKDENKRQ